MLNIFEHLPSSEHAMSYIKYIITAVSSFGAGASTLHWFQLKTKNHKHRVRNINLKKLRIHLEECPSSHVYIKVAQKEVFGVHGYHFTLDYSNESQKNGPTNTFNIFSRQTILAGHYSVRFLGDGILFTMLDANGSETSHDLALFTD